MWNQVHSHNDMSVWFHHSFQDILEEEGSNPQTVALGFFFRWADGLGVEPAYRDYVKVQKDKPEEDADLADMEVVWEDEEEEASTEEFEQELPDDTDPEITDAKNNHGQKDKMKGPTGAEVGYLQKNEFDLLQEAGQRLEKERRKGHWLEETFQKEKVVEKGIEYKIDMSFWDEWRRQKRGAGFTR